MSIPPGPKLPAVLQVLQWSLRPLPFLDECARRYGETFTIQFADIGAVVFVSRPEHIKQVFTGDSTELLAGKANELLRPMLGPSSILLLDGKDHMRARRLLMPPFHGERMQAYAEIMRDITEAEINKMPIGRAFSLHPHMQAITLDVILRAVFGLDRGAGMRSLSDLIVDLLQPPPAIFTFLPALQVDFPMSPFRIFLRRKEKVDRELYALIEERRRAKDLASRTDILSLMLSARDEDGQPMTDEELHDELITMLVAGHETTATTLTWAFERLLSEPRAARKLYAELGAVIGEGQKLDPAALPRLEYTDAVIKETLRVRPIIPIVVRHLEVPLEIGGYDLPSGANVAPCIYLTHRRPDIYPEPERFLPERFVGAKIDPYAFLPFGGGVRRCLGMAFALYEMKIILATVLSRAYLRSATTEPEKVVRRGIALAPSGGGRVIVGSPGTELEFAL